MGPPLRTPPVLSPQTPLRPGATPLHVGAAIAGKYQLVRELGRGGMGVVYEARHLELDIAVALKVVLPQHAESSEITQRLLEEARSAARVRSEHAVAILDVGTLGNRSPYIVMEYVEGESLQARLERLGRLPLAEAVDFVAQACAAIAAAHSGNVIHRDLKPENLLLTQRADGSPLVKVVDFGLSKRLDRADLKLTNPSLTMGSPQYMSPEQINAAADVDARTDIWSLGVILYELTTGQPPFQADTVMALFAQILAGEPPAPSRVEASLPPEFDALVLGCLQVDPAQRFASITQLLEALLALPSADPHSLSRSRMLRVARPTRTTDELASAVVRRAPPTRLRLLASAGAVLLAGLGVGTAYQFRGASGTDSAALAPLVAEAALTPAATMSSADVGEVAGEVNRTRASSASGTSAAARPVTVVARSNLSSANAAHTSERALPVAKPSAKRQGDVKSAATPSPKVTAPETSTAPKSAWDLDAFGGRH